MMTDTPAARARLKADLVNIERARIYGAAKTIAEQTNLTAALMVFDATRARLVRDCQGQEGWVG